MFQEVPPPRLVVRAQEQYGLGTGTTPENAWSFQAQVDDAAYSTFDGTASNRQLQGHQLRVDTHGLTPVALAKEVFMYLEGCMPSNSLQGWHSPTPIKAWSSAIF